MVLIETDGSEEQSREIKCPRIIQYIPHHLNLTAPHNNWCQCFSAFEGNTVKAGAIFIKAQMRVSQQKTGTVRRRKGTPQNFRNILDILHDKFVLVAEDLFPNFVDKCFVDKLVISICSVVGRFFGRQAHDNQM